MATRARFKVENMGEDYCDFEEGAVVEDAFDLIDPADYPADQQELVAEFNRRAELGNQRYRIACYREEMFAKGFDAGMYICTFDRDENMTSFVFTDETRRMLGYDGLDDLPNEFESWIKTLLPEEREIMRPVFWQTVRSHRDLPDISHAEYRMVRKDGSIIWVTGAGRFIRREDDGSLEIYMGCYREVTAEHEKDDYLKICEGIGRIFNFSLYIDLTDNSYRLISTNEFVEMAPKDPDAFIFLQNNVNTTVDVAFRDSLNAWFEKDNVLANLAKNAIATSDFRSAEADRWFRATFMEGDRDENGALAHIIYGCQDITDAKLKDLRQQQMLAESVAKRDTQLQEIAALNERLLAEQTEHFKESATVEALASGYTNVYLVQRSTRTLEIVKLDGYVTKGMSRGTTQRFPYDAACEAYIGPRVLEEDKPAVRAFLNWDNVLAALEQDGFTKLSYRVVDEGEVHYYQGHIRGVGDPDYFVAGFQCIDDMVQEREEHAAALERQLNIVGSLSTTFASIYYIDLRTMHFVELGKSRKTVTDAIGTQGDATRALDMMCTHVVAPEYADEMREFADLSTINDRLKERPWVSRQFLAVGGKWDEGAFVAAKRDDEGNCLNILWAVRDITEVKSREMAYLEKIEEARAAAEAANDAKTSFLFNMSHDIRTPLNAITGFTGLLRKHQDEPDRREDYLGKIEDSSEVLLNIINNVLDMARIERGAATLEETAWGVGQLSDSISSVFTEMMREKRLDFVTSMQVEHEYVYCDPTKLTQVFNNILSNAFKYTNPGGRIEMHVEELPGAQPDRALYRTTISDTGIGMDADYLPHLFEEFSRERTSTETKIQGTGLGMPIVKRLVDIMGGTIEVTSEKGVGSTFVITLPHRIAEKSELMSAGDMVFDPALFQGKRILLTEDNQLNAEIAIEILGEAGFEVDHAEDGLAAVKALAAAPMDRYDVVLMDIQMPNMNGYDAARAIRTMSDSSKASIPIIAMTANAFEEDKKAAFDAGMDGHVAKPINLTELMSALANLLA